jgi:peptide-methionine (R)-S-oxide reductase
MAALAGVTLLGLTGCAPTSVQASEASYESQTVPRSMQLQRQATDQMENPRFTDGPYKGYLRISPERPDKVTRSEAEWKELLTGEEFRIMRQQGTESPFCSPFLDVKESGIWYVRGTKHPVFRTETKFDSGTGWPSFWEPIDMDSVWLREDRSHGMVRMEVLDSASDSHLGHVFPDGPRNKTGLRFCINGEALYFVPDGKEPDGIRGYLP